MSGSLASSSCPSRRKPLAACVAALFGLSSAPAVHAGTAIVTNCSSEVVLGSLPWAAAQAVNDGDIIDMTGISDFSKCFSNYDGFAHTILVASAVTVATGVTIKGPNTSGSKILAVSTNNFDRVFYSPGYLTINNLGIKYGTATDKQVDSGGYSAFGGCVFAKGGMYLDGVVLDHCTAEATRTGRSANGGSIATSAGLIVLTNSTITYSYATSNLGSARGGAIAAGSQVGLANSTVHGAGAYQNSSYGGLAAGGCIFAGQGVYLSDNSFVVGCSAETAANPALGGGIYSGAYVSLQQSAVGFTRAISLGGTASGGGIFSVGSTEGRGATVYQTYAASFSDSEGGAIFSQDGVKFTYGTIAASAAVNGGGIFVKSGDLYLRGVTLSNNYALSHASALVMATGDSGVATIVNSTISGNTVGSTSGKYAVLIAANTTTFLNSTIAYNTGGTGAGTFLALAGSNVGLYSTLMSSNSQSNGTQNDFSKNTNATITAGSSNNLIRNPGSIVPNGTLTGAAACPHLHKLADNGGPTATHRLGGAIHGAGKNPAIDAGSNPVVLKPDQRGGFIFATTPARVSGSAADIGAYEVQQDDVVFDTDFETCPN